LKEEALEQDKTRRVIIYGAGAIGGVVGGHLARVGYDVILVGRPGQVKAVQENGLRLVTPDGTHILKVLAVTAPDRIEFRPDDVVFLCVKGQNTEEALRDLKAVIQDIPVFCFQNGVRNEELALQYFPGVYGVRVQVGGVYLTDGEVIARRDPPGWLIMGCYPTGIDELVEVMAARLRDAGFFVMGSLDVMPYKWGKLMRNLGNAIGAITNARGDDVDVIGRAVRQEAQEVLAQADIHWVSQEELAQEWPESTSQPRNTLSVEAQSSTWQSLARRQGTVETDFLNGEIVRLARRLGREAPMNQTLFRISQEMAVNDELPGKYAPTELSSLLGLSRPS